MATFVVTGDQYRNIDRRMREIKRQLDQPEGSSLDPAVVEQTLETLQLIIERKTIDAPTSTPTEAARIMGRNFHGTDEVEAKFGVNFTAKQHRLLSVVPFSAEVLQACAETHILVAGYALSIIDIHGRATDAFYSKTRPWYGEPEQRFATKTKVTVAWHLVRKSALPDSTSKSWSDQRLLVNVPDTIPPTCLVVYTAILHFLVRPPDRARLWRRAERPAQ